MEGPGRKSPGPSTLPCVGGYSTAAIRPRHGVVESSRAGADQRRPRGGGCGGAESWGMARGPDGGGVARRRGGGGGGRPAWGRALQRAACPAAARPARARLPPGAERLSAGDGTAAARALAAPATGGDAPGGVRRGEKRHLRRRRGPLRRRALVRPPHDRLRL